MEKKSDDSRAWRLFIGNMDRRLTDADILKLTSKYGKIKAVSERIPKTGPKKGRRLNYCFVDYESEEAADKARISLNGKIIGFKILQVRWARQSGYPELTMITGTGKRKYDCNEGNRVASISRNLRATTTMVEVIQKKLKSMEKKG
ncbi:uncharacterized protein TRIADDRAFT_55715 [Trichoplax adhaerens]|uniref:Probable RNA-binding protein 18 n=1 Tax=Trichoplax adhaerens TaxID=10228 RepID=B3RVN4_TRIAD|nr:hypothetical protein TRIADDRAFT_55715 [Trichoplax adhaerens]EDV25530.1 hypothetical protein TRIADDRAFT_55715 [Trichoplax adhaerens]|eukprot:XP_002111563.1 hypothetical protein TRIADDRAFT_55715 [Trichoplax adhaerens]